MSDKVGSSEHLLDIIKLKTKQPDQSSIIE